MPRGTNPRSIANLKSGSNKRDAQKVLVSLEASLLADLDKVVSDKGISNRSRAVEEAIESWLKQRS